MTKHEQAMADILQVSLFKWAEAMHKALDEKRKRFPDKREECDAQAVTVEHLVDSMMEQHKTVGTEKVMEMVENLHKMITQL